jgi:ABC-type nitrate/sulfonate/bicarbonate transport system permease component
LLRVSSAVDATLTSSLPTFTAAAPTTAKAAATPAGDVRNLAKFLNAPPVFAVWVSSLPSSLPALFASVSIVILILAASIEIALSPCS